MSNEELVEEHRRGTRSALEELWIQNSGIIRKMVKKYQGVNGSERDDLEQESFLALCFAVEHYEAGSDIQFVSYLTNCLQWHLYRYINKLNPVHVPSNCRLALRKYKLLCASCIREYHRAPTEGEIQRETGLDKYSLRRIEKAVYAASLNATIDSEDEGAELLELIEDTAAGKGFESAIDDLQNRELASVLWPLVDDLPQDQQTIIKQIYQQGRNLAEAASGSGMSYDRARQEKANALRELRREKSATLLRPFLDDSERYSRGVQHVGVRSFENTWMSSTEAAAIRQLMKGQNDK